MESVEIFEKSYTEIQKLKKDLTLNNVSIDFDKLDTKTSGMLREAMCSVLSKRSREISTIISVDCIS